MNDSAIDQSADEIRNNDEEKSTSPCLPIQNASKEREHLANNVVIESLVDDEIDCGLKVNAPEILGIPKDEGMMLQTNSASNKSLDIDDFEDETIEERLAALVDAFPPRLVHLIRDTFNSAASVSSVAIRFAKKTLWIASTSFTILVLPVLFETEMNAINEQYSNEVRQMMLGPAAAAVSSGSMVPSFATNALSRQ
ncbi:hypothetical protein ACOME3_009729 [Neoechinorhynchus agilis]